MTPRRLLLAAAAVAVATSAMTMTASEPAGGEARRLIRVPEDVATPRAAIEAAQPGDVILLAPGTYEGGLIVPEAKHDLTIRGADRNGVVIDGKGFSINAIEIQADNVTVENLSAHDFDGNAFYWERVDGFTGRYLTVWNVNLYGIYATESTAGLFEESFVSGAADAAFYVGECQPTCTTTVQKVEARLSAVGYSGTNTGDELKVIDSVFDRNGTAILPNSYEGQAAQPPERGSVISGNTIRDSGTVPVPTHTPLAGWWGIGIGIAGGVDNQILDNTISGSARYGIALFPTLQQSGAIYAAGGNLVRDNRVAGSGTADLALAPMLGVAGEPNCFSRNTAGITLPEEIPTAPACEAAVGSQGDARVGEDLSISIPEALEKLAALGPRPDYRSMPKPDPQRDMPDPLPAGLRPFRDPPADPIGTIGPLAAAFVVVAAIATGIVASARRRSQKRGQVT